MSCNQCNKTCDQMEVQELVDLPIDTIPSVPDFFLVERVGINEATGKVTHSLTRIPGNRVLPNGTLDNVFTMDGNNPSFTVPENQVVPAYVQNNGTSNTVMPAGGSHKAQFLVINIENQLFYCQNCGIVNILAGHPYIVGIDYYLGGTGEVTTVPSGQYLFTPISPTQLALNMAH